MKLFQTARLKSWEIKRVGCSVREKMGIQTLRRYLGTQIHFERSDREEEDSLHGKRFRASSSSWDKREKAWLEVELLSIIHQPAFHNIFLFRDSSAISDLCLKPGWRTLLQSRKALQQREEVEVNLYRMIIEKEAIFVK